MAGEEQGQESIFTSTDMKHNRLRKEPNCLNCGHIVPDRYCSHCGQENLELHDSSWHLVVHYVQDLFHYDGRLWHTLRNLVRKPGNAAVEYMEGKRRSNLEPIRFYVFASTVFFILLYFSVGSLSERATITNNTPPPVEPVSIEDLLRTKEALRGTDDTTHVNALLERLTSQADMSDTLDQDTPGSNLEFNLGVADTSALQYSNAFEKWLFQRLTKKDQELREKYGDNDSKKLIAVLDEIFLALPKLIFLSLPFFALLLKLFYWRSFRKLYVDHFIFSIYIYAFFFTIFSGWLGLQMLITSVGGSWPEGVIGWIYAVLAAYPFVYLLLAMKRFYNDRWPLLIFRFIGIVLLFWILILILFVLTAALTLLF